MSINLVVSIFCASLNHVDNHDNFWGLKIRTYVLESSIHTPLLHSKFKYSIHIFQWLFHLSWPEIQFLFLSFFSFSLSLNLQESVFLPVKWIRSPAPDKAVLSLCINCRQFKGQIVVLPSLCGRVCCHCSLALKRWLDNKTIQMQMKHSKRISP